MYSALCPGCRKKLKEGCWALDANGAEQTAGLHFETMMDKFLVVASVRDFGRNTEGTQHAYLRVGAPSSNSVYKRDNVDYIPVLLYSIIPLLQAEGSSKCIPNMPRFLIKSRP